MDFLKIRKKAKERAGAKARSAPGAAGAAADAIRAAPRAAKPAAPPPPPEAGKATAPAATDAAAPAPAGAPRQRGAGKAAAPAVPDAAAPSPAATRRARGPRGAGVPETPPPDPVVTEVDVLEGELAARLQGVPPPADERFTTWRPGAGKPPDVVPPPGGDVQPREEDFALVALPGPWPAEHRAASLRAPATSEPSDPLDDFFYRPDEAAGRLPSIGAAAVEPIPEPGSRAIEEYLTFLLGSEEYAVPIDRVREVLRAPPVTEVPRAPADVLGVVTVRGDVVPVFDPRRRLGLPPVAADPESGRTRIVIVDAGEGTCGLLVDAVASVVRIPAGGIEPCPQGIATASAESIEGIGRFGERLFMVLDLGVLLRRAGPPGPGAGAGRPDAGA